MLRKLPIYYSYQCEKNVDLYLINKAGFDYRLLLNNEWNFNYRSGAMFRVDQTKDVLYPEKDQNIISVDDKYKENLYYLYDSEFNIMHSEDFVISSKQYLRNGEYLGINLDYFYLFDGYSEHYIHSLLITKARKRRLFLVDPDNKTLNKEWLEIEQIQKAFLSNHNNRQYYTFLKKNSNLIDNFKLQKKVLEACMRQLKVYRIEKDGGISNLLLFLDDLNKLINYDYKMILFISELCYSLLINILNQRNHYYLFIKAVIQNFTLSTKQKYRFRKLVNKFIKLAIKWKILRNMFYKTAQLEKSFMHDSIRSICRNLTEIIKLERFLLQDFFNEINNIYSGYL